jgi:hypothetical protein
MDNGILFSSTFANSTVRQIAMLITFTIGIFPALMLQLIPYYEERTTINDCQLRKRII